MKILKSSILLILLTLFAHARSIEDIQKSGEMVIAVYENFPPYSFIKDGKLTGIDVDLGKKLAASLDVKPVFYQTGTDETLSDDLRNTLWKGNLIHRNKADVMFRVPYDYDYLRLTDDYTGELINERVSIRGPYQSERWVIATHKKVIPEFKNLAIFAYHTIGVELDALPDLHLSAFARGLIRENVKHYFKYEDAVKDFLSGKIDAIAGLKSQLEYYLDYNNNQDKYFMSDSIPQVKSKWDLAVAVDSEFRPLSYHIDGLLHEEYENGNIAKIFEKYGVKYQAPIAKTVE
ncbi:hypothetical protein GCM10012288_11880 [Malaciobacter pacificus]|uniref:Extracellular solute-binding protein n=1 Tax=Malaciobacter pacificus TaxID=1080223 RepID=A0A5C2H9N1_9BACT|nr:transporter substrate-binding domain-containing protein [Malaciobacter pacificus]QEP33534.1 extracellular solute-binding protein [Malaciobacter pacificus]GGD39437.1 hypothetical protein GCM10012288_11880 [Malaciobacter pacificus]